MSITEEIEKKFVDTLALLVIEQVIPSKSEYRNGWVDGYAEAWSQMTGKSSAGLFAKVNDCLRGSGKQLVR
jgi:hypothetical protein